MPSRYAHIKVGVLGGTVTSTISTLSSQQFITTAILAAFGAVISFLCSVMLKYLFKHSRWKYLVKRKSKQSKRRK